MEKENEDLHYFLEQKETIILANKITNILIEHKKNWEKKEEKTNNGEIKIAIDALSFILSRLIKNSFSEEKAILIYEHIKKNMDYFFML